jgi:5-methylcytosine-specific restriction protein A
MGRLTLANTVDHVTAISEGGPAFPGHDGLASYCPACHSAKTARGGEAGAVRSTKPRRGCDASGRPLDPNHAWSRKDAAVPFEKSLRADAQIPPSNLHKKLVSKDIV